MTSERASAVHGLNGVFFEIDLGLAEAVGQLALCVTGLGVAVRALLVTEWEGGRVAPVDVEQIVRACDAAVKQADALSDGMIAAAKRARGEWE